MKFNLLLCAVGFLLATSCKKNQNQFDASGTFEADEIIISAETTGKLNQFTINEGDELKPGQIIGYIDSTQVYLKKKQVEAQITALLGRKPNIGVQLSALQQQLETAQREQMRVTSLVKADAATTKQLDDVNAQVEVIKKQIAAQRSTLDISTSGISKEAVPLIVQIQQINDQLSKCKLVNPINGTVLAKYAEPNEMATAGKALYKIADLSTIVLRAYVSADQLPSIKLNQAVTVLTDDGKGGYTRENGTLTWINSKAEFTPKTIQTKNERANTVYAIKISVKNNGTYKIGMYGAVNFDNNSK